MDANAPYSATGGMSMPPPGFHPALKPTSGTSEPVRTSGNPGTSGTGARPASLRDASGGSPPVPSVAGPSTSSENTKTGEEQAPKAPLLAKPINRPATSKNAIVYNAVQRRNPVLQSIKNVGIEIGDITADYQVGTHNGVLFLSLKYHRLHPEYIHQRIEKMRNMYSVRILLILCDINEHQQSIRELSKIAVINQLTTFVAWSNEEVAQYLTTFKAYEHRGADSLKEPVHQSYHEQLQHVLTSGKKVNKTDADNLAAQFGSLANISRQPSKVLSNVKGLGATKVTSLIDAFTKPFLVGGLKRDVPSTEPISSVPTGIEGHRTESLDPIGSPEWPDDPEEELDAQDPPPVTFVDPDRAQSQSPEARPVEGDGEVERNSNVWKDPLDDEDDEPVEPVAKRARVDE